MPVELVYILLATLLVSSGSLVGALTLTLSRPLLARLLLPLVSLSAGTMLGASFLHLLPESLATLGDTLPLRLALAAFIGFFLLERVLHWRHCHDEDHLESHTTGTLNLLGDAVHNFLDGALIAASFATSFELGVISTVAIALHEIPQELGDFGVLLHSGFSRRSALLANVGVSVTALLGGLFGYFASHAVASLSSFLLPIAAGGFIYISASDLIPALKAGEAKSITPTTLIFLLGIAFMFLIPG